MAMCRRAKIASSAIRTSVKMMMVVQPGRCGCWKKATVAANDPRVTHSIAKTRAVAIRTVLSSDLNARKALRRLVKAAKLALSSACGWVRTVSVKITPRRNKIYIKLSCGCHRAVS